MSQEIIRITDPKILKAAGFVFRDLPHVENNSRLETDSNPKTQIEIVSGNRYSINGAEQLD